MLHPPHHTVHRRTAAKNADATCRAPSAVRRPYQSVDMCKCQRCGAPLHGPSASIGPISELFIGMRPARDHGVRSPHELGMISLCDLVVRSHQCRGARGIHKKRSNAHDRIGGDWRMLSTSLRITSVAFVPGSIAAHAASSPRRRPNVAIITSGLYAGESVHQEGRIGRGCMRWSGGARRTGGCMQGGTPSS